MIASDHCDELVPVGDGKSEEGEKDLGRVQPGYVVTMSHAAAGPRSASIRSRIWARSPSSSALMTRGRQHLVQDPSVADVIGRVDGQRDQWDGTTQLVEGPRRGEDVAGSGGRTAPLRDW